MKRFFTWWDRLTMPFYGPDTTAQQRERLRYARLISRFSLVVFLLVAFYTPNLILTQPPLINFSVALGVALVILGLFLNRAGFSSSAGMCCIACCLITITTPMYSTTLDTPGLILFSQLTIIVVVAGALLPPIAMLIVAAINCLIIALGLTMLPRTLALDTLLRNNMYTYFLPPMILQVVVAVIMYFIIRSLLSAIRRADRAEEIAALQKEIAANQQTRMQENRQMEDGLANLANVLSWVARGKMDARASVTQGSALRSIAGPLNTLLQRAQAWKEDSDNLARTRFFIGEATKTLQDARAKHQSIIFNRTGTALDPLLQEINLTYEPDPTIGPPTHRRPMS